MELRVNDYNLPDTISFNFDELKTGISAKAEQYAHIVYTDDNIKAAKEDRADLNRLKKALNDERIRRQKEYLAPFDAFKKQIDEIITIIDKPVQAIDIQIKQFEQIKQDEKRAAIEDMFKNMFFPEFVKLDEKIFDPKWLNATCSMKSIEESLLKTKEDIISNVQTLAGLPSYSHEAVIYYQRTLDVTGALAKVRELSEIEAAKKKMLQKAAEDAQAYKEYQEALDKASEPIPVIPVAPDTPAEPQMWVQFEALLSSTQAAALKTFFNANGIEFRPIKIKEDK